MKISEFGDLQNSLLILADASWSFHFQIAISDFKERGGKIVFYIHDLIPLNPLFKGQEILDIKFKKWIDWGIAHADLLLCVSQDSLKNLQYYSNLAGFSSEALEERSIVLLSGHEESRSTVETVSRSVRSLFEGKVVHDFLVVGSADHRKNLKLIYSSFVNLWEQGYHCRLVLAGPFTVKDKFIETLKHSKYINQSLFIFSNLNDVDLDYLYHHVSALVFVSESEGFGLPLVEAMTRGLPIICSDIPIFRELAEGYARFVDISKEDGLADSVIEFLKETLVEERLLRSPRPWRSWDDYANELLAICQELAGGEVTVSAHKD